MVVYGEYGPSSTLNGKYSHLTMTRDCNPGIPESRKFSNPKIPGLSRTQSRDFGINKIYLFNGFLVLFKIILCIYSFFDDPQDNLKLGQRWANEYFNVGPMLANNVGPT